MTFTLDENNQFNLVVTEYPKSGGTWLVSLIGSVLDLPKRDIYIKEDSVRDANATFYKNILNHPWYAGYETVDIISPSVIKSHELPASSIIPSNVRFLHLIRDGRDIVVSKYIYEKEFCVQNGLIPNFNKRFDDYLIEVATEWKNYIEAWLSQAIPIVKYEDLLINTKEVLFKILNSYQVLFDENKIDSAIVDNSKHNLREKLKSVYQYNTFIRKGIIGDWKNHFTLDHQEIFNEIAGETLIKLGYL